jgi:hypothetical protein
VAIAVDNNRIQGVLAIVHTQLETLRRLSISQNEEIEVENHEHALFVNEIIYLLFISYLKVKMSILKAERRVFKIRQKTKKK